jgi:PD-(D/E)XK nuclease superfamily
LWPFIRGYQVKSNRESGLGRYDILLIPHDDRKPGVIIEFKKVRKSETLETAAQRALDQIVERKYAHELTEKGIESILAYGIALEGKNLFIKELGL